MDQDYIDKLSDDEKKFLSDFNEEYYSGGFNHEGKKLHRTKKERRECYSRNNARNRDLYTISRTRGWVVGADDSVDLIESTQPTEKNTQEEALIDLIDLKKKLE